MKLKLLEGKALSKLIGAIGQARVTLDGQVQEAALQVIGQSIVHRNTTPANSLLDAVSKHHKATLVTYCEKFGNFQWDKKAEVLAFREVYTTEQIDEALEKIGDAKWFDAKKPARVVSEYDAVKQIGDVLDRLFKFGAKEGVTIKNKPVLEAVHATYLKATAAQYEAPAQAVSANQRQVDRVADLAASAAGRGFSAEPKAA